MKPHPRHEEQDDLLRPRLTDMIDMRHELAKLIDWDFFEREWAGFLRQPGSSNLDTLSGRLPGSIG